MCIYTYTHIYYIYILIHTHTHTHTHLTTYERPGNQTARQKAEANDVEHMEDHEQRHLHMCIYTYTYITYT